MLFVLLDCSDLLSGDAIRSGDAFPPHCVTMECQFGPCTCTVSNDEHCGPTCRLGIGQKGEPCKCGHDECSATEGEANVSRTRPGG